MMMRESIEIVERLIDNDAGMFKRVADKLEVDEMTTQGLLRRFRRENDIEDDDDDLDFGSVAPDAYNDPNFLEYVESYKVEQVEEAFGNLFTIWKETA